MIAISSGMAPQDLDFFTDATPTFDEFFASYDRIYVDRRCHHFISQTRQYVTQPYIDLTEVGS